MCAPVVASETNAQAENKSQQGIQIRLVDQNNKPVKNAVVSFIVSAPNSDYQHIDNKHTKNSPAVMDQVNISYQPRVLLIQKGDWVDFPNSDNVRHHVYSFSPTKPFEIKMYKGGDADAIKFDQSGLVVLGCNIHDSMVGFIYVSDTNNTVLSDENGVVLIDSEVSEILVWHEYLPTNGEVNERKKIDVSPNISKQTVALSLDYPNNTETVPQVGFKNKFKRGG